MTSFRVSFIPVFLTFTVLVQASPISGPACARRNYGSADCLSKCGGNWGFGTHVMGQDEWGQVMLVSSTDSDFNDAISKACGLSSSPDSSSDPSTVGGTPSTSSVSNSVDHSSPSSYTSSPAVPNNHPSDYSPSLASTPDPAPSAKPATLVPTTPASPSPSHSNPPSSSNSSSGSNSSLNPSSDSNPSLNSNPSPNSNPSSKSSSSSKSNSSSSSNPLPNSTPSLKPGSLSNINSSSNLNSSSSSNPLPNSTPLLKPGSLSNINSSSNLNSSSSSNSSTSSPLSGSPSPVTHTSVKRHKSITSVTQTPSSDIDALLTAHNTVRAQHGAVNLAWNTSLATAALTWATGCKFEHSGGTLGPYGENIAAGTGGYTIADGVGDWTNEVSDYDASNPVPSHFTQVVWKGTTQLGCALVTCAAGTIFDAGYGTTNYLVCEYSPPGNVIGEFAQNVQA